MTLTRSILISTRRPARTLVLCLAFACSAAAALATAAGASAQTFSSTGAEQTYTVPARVTEIHVVAVGATGYTTTAAGGHGGVVTANLPVTAGQTLFVEVGGNGVECFFGCPPPAFNGGNLTGGGGAGGISNATGECNFNGSAGSLGQGGYGGYASGGGGGGYYGGGGGAVERVPNSGSCLGLLFTTVLARGGGNG